MPNHYIPYLSKNSGKNQQYLRRPKKSKKQKYPCIHLLFCLCYTARQAAFSAALADVAGDLKDLASLDDDMDATAGAGASAGVDVGAAGDAEVSMGFAGGLESAPPSADAVSRT